MARIKFTLSSADKIKAGVIAVALTLTTFLVIKNWGYFTGNVPDETIASWVEDHTYPHDRSIPIGPNNVDPKSTRVTVFAFHEGQIQLIEFPYDSSRSSQMTILFKGDYRRVKTDPYHDALAKDSDPAKQAILFAVAQNANHRPWVLREASLTDDQGKDERDAREKMNDALTMINIGVNEGTFDAKLYQQIQDALGKYRQNEAEITKDKGKQLQATQIVALCRQYLDKVQKSRDEVVATYVKSVYGMLDGDQKTKLGHTMESMASRFAPRRKTTAG